MSQNTPHTPRTKMYQSIYCVKYVSKLYQEGPKVFYDVSK